MVGAMNGVALLSAYLIRSAPWQWCAALLISLPVLAFFHLTWWIVAATFINAFGVWSAMRATSHDVASRLVVRPWASVSAGSSSIVLATMIALSLIIGNQVVGLHQTPQQRVDRLVTGLVSVLERGLSTTLRGVTPNMTIDQAISTKLPSAESLLHSLGITEQLSPNQQEQLSQRLQDNLGINAEFQSGQTTTQLTKEVSSVLQQYEGQSISEIRKQLSLRVGIPLQGNQTVHDALLQAIRHQVEKPALRFASYFGLVAAVTALLLLRLFSYFFSWATIVCGTIWYWILRRFRIVTIQQRVEEVEHLDWRGD